MSNLNLTAQWHDNINQVDVTEPIVGGDGGNANLATRQLAENILWLKQRMANQINEAYAVGDIYTTTINHVSAAAVAAHHGYGTWVRYAEGRTVVGQSTKAADPDDYKIIGNTFGENEHKLTIEETPSHKHSHSSRFQHFMSPHFRGESIPSGDTAQREQEFQLHQISAAEFAEAKEESRGGDQPHNNIQPSIVAGCWLRTA